MNRILQSLEEALEISRGEMAAPRIYINGHTYVPKTLYDQVVKELEELKKKLEENTKDA